MMVTLTFITDADRKRPGLMYRIEFETAEVYGLWNGLRWFAENREQVMGEGLAANTVVIVHQDNLHTMKYFLRWDQVVEILDHAEGLPRGVVRSGSGRYPNRVLQAMTTKQRREGPRRAGW